MKALDDLRRKAESFGFVLVPQHTWEAMQRKPRRSPRNAKWAIEMAALKRCGAVRISLDRFQTKAIDAVRHRMKNAAGIRGMRVRVRIVGGMVYVFQKTTKEME